MAAFRDESFALSRRDRPERVGGAIVNANFFDVLGVDAGARPRASTRRDERPGAARVAVLSDGTVAAALRRTR